MVPKVLFAGALPTQISQAGLSRLEADHAATLEEGAQRLQLTPYPVAVFRMLGDPAQLLDSFKKAHAGSAHTSFILLVEPEFEAVAAEIADEQTQVTCLPSNTSAALLQIAINHGTREHERRKLRTRTMEESVNGTLATLLEILSIIDPYSASLGQRLRYALDSFVKAARLPLTWELETAAMLAEIGVLTIPVRVLLKQNSGQEISGFEKDMLARVPERGGDLLQQIPFFSHVAKIVRYRDKHFDGSGLPTDSTAQDRLPLGSRILKLLNDLLKLEDSGNSRDQALDIMQGTTGKYDPNLLKVARDTYSMSLPTRIPSAALKLTLKDLRPGQLLVAKVETKDGVLLLRDGQLISPKIIHKLRNFAYMSGIREPIHVVDLLESRGMISVFQDLAHNETSFLSRTAPSSQGAFVA